MPKVFLIILVFYSNCKKKNSNNIWLFCQIDVHEIKLYKSRDFPGQDIPPAEI